VKRALLILIKPNASCVPIAFKDVCTHECVYANAVPRDNLRMVTVASEEKNRETRVKAEEAGSFIVHPLRHYDIFTNIKKLKDISRPLG
jgi:hypothetical protein